MLVSGLVFGLRSVAGLAYLVPTHRVLDLSQMLYRCVHAIGGGWTEQLHIDSDLRRVAERWSRAQNLPSVRTCPLCREGPGTPRHVVMSCPAMRPLVDQWRDDLEAELISTCGGSCVPRIFLAVRVAAARGCARSREG